VLGECLLDLCSETDVTRLALAGVVGLGVALFSVPAVAKEYPVGKPQLKAGMEIAAVYLQPIEMDPPGMMRLAKDSDIHLEADVRAAKDNANGFSDGDFIPYLEVAYELTRLDDQATIKGVFMPMVASDGPHYGDNVKLMGPGKYKLALKIAPPPTASKAQFGRHVDKETGVASWFEPFTVEYDFTYAGIGKKGAY
jgi:uncharacterized protein involved in high-affinity Fe2+ transport